MSPARLSLFLLAVLTFGLAGNVKANAATFTASGNFAADNSSYRYDFTSTSTQNYTFFTTSYASGGFVPVLTLFTGSGAIVGSDGASGTCSGSATKDATTKMCDDAYFATQLSAGSYSLYLTEFPNVAIGNLADGFLFASSPNATGDLCGVSGGKFLQTDTATCVQRSSGYALTVNSNSPVPEPGTWALLLPALAGLYFVDQRRRQQQLL